MNDSYHSFRDKRYQLPNMLSNPSANCNNLGLAVRFTLNPYILPAQKEGILLRSFHSFPIIACGLPTFFPFLQNAALNPFRPQNPCSQILRRIAESKHVVLDELDAVWGCSKIVSGAVGRIFVRITVPLA